MQAFLWSLALAAISALAFVAYRHPVAYYKRIFPALAAVVIAVLIYSVGAFTGVVASAADGLAREVASDAPRTEIVASIASDLKLVVRAVKWELAIAVVTLGYLLLLSSLPLILDLPLHGHSGQREPEA